MRFLASRALFRWFCAGRGAGKTWALVNDSILGAVCDPGGKSLLTVRVGNDISQTMNAELDEQFSILQRATGINWITKWNRTAPCYLRLVNGHTLWLRPYDKIGQLRGTRYGRVNIDELMWTYTVPERTAWDQLRILATLPSPMRGVAVASSPNGMSPATREFVDAQKDGDSRYHVTRALATDNEFLAPEMLEAISRGMSKRAYRQEIMAEILRSADVVFPEFDLDRHVIPFNAAAARKEGWPWILACDWNTYACAIYVDPRSFRWVIADELVMKDTPERKTGHDRFWHHLLEFVKRHGGKPRFSACDRALPRYNAKLAQTLGVHSDWSRSIEEQSVANGIEEIRDMLDPHEGEPRLVVSSSLDSLKPEDQRVAPMRHALGTYRYLRDRFGQITDTPKKDDVCDHSIDALSYAVKCANRRWISLLGGVTRQRAWTQPRRRGVGRYG
tara:strand:+ start:957 stop:2294 length:1338 start_codon:yes stop_codon:yes gene_type:complete